MRLITLSHFAQFGSTSRLCPPACTRNEACPIQVIPISSFCSFGKIGAACSPARLANKEGMSTWVRKLRLCQVPLGLSPTLVAHFRAGTGTLLRPLANSDFLIAAFGLRSLRNG